MAHKVESLVGASSGFPSIVGVIQKKQMRLCSRRKSAGSDISNVSSVFLKETGCHINDELRILCKQGRWKQALHLLDCKKQQGSSLTFAYTCLLKECMDAKALAEGTQIHAHMVKNGLMQNIILKNTLIHMYVKCASMEYARDVFDSTPCKDTFSWTVMIGGYTKYGPSEEAFKLFGQMELEGVKPNEVTAVIILSSCLTLSLLMEVHSHIIKIGINPNLYVGNTLVNMYSKCGSASDALQVFNQLPFHDVVSHNTMIACFADHSRAEDAFQLYNKLKIQGFDPDEVTFLGIVKACASLRALKQIHLEINQKELKSRLFVASTLVDMYAKFGSVKDARLLFNRIQVRDVALWNTIILGYAQQGDAFNAFAMFVEMEKDGLASDKVTFLSLLKACAIEGLLGKGKEIHAHLIVRGLETSGFMESALIDMYVKCGNVVDARYIFENMTRPDLVCWNALIGGYSMQGMAATALALFHKMEMAAIEPDKVTFLALLRACATLGALEQGMHVHACIVESKLNLDTYIGSTLIDMYAKCGSVNHAQAVFSSLPNKDSVTSSAMIAGFAQHGHAERAFELFWQMESKRVEPDDVTFVGLLTACAHAGLVEEGWRYFMYMKNQLNMVPTAEHCACVVNLLGRTGRVKEAVKFIKHVAGVESSSSVWMALLSACRLSGYLDLAGKASERVLQLEPQSTAAFVLLSNVHAQGSDLLI